MSWVTHDLMHFHKVRDRLLAALAKMGPAERTNAVTQMARVERAWADLAEEWPEGRCENEVMPMNAFLEVLDNLDLPRTEAKVKQKARPKVALVMEQERAKWREG